MRAALLQNPSAARHCPLASPLPPPPVPQLAAAAAEAAELPATRAALEEALKDAEAAKGLVTAERERAATLEKARAAAVEVGPFPPCARVALALAAGRRLQRRCVPAPLS